MIVKKKRKKEPLNEINQKAAAAKETDTWCTSDRESDSKEKDQIDESPVTAHNALRAPAITWV